MASTSSRNSSLSDEDLSAEEVSMSGESYGKNGSESSSTSGGGLSAEEDASAFSICGRGAYAEEELDSMACSAGNSKARPVRQSVTEERSNSGPMLDVGIWSALYDHLLEKIIARLPFKSLFQAETLSKTWRQKVHSHSFQTEVLHSSSASSWKSYAPLFVNGKKDLLGYESSSKRWHRLPTHSYLSEEMVRGWDLAAVTGTLFCWTCLADEDVRFVEEEVYVIHVTNPLTESWKRLPPRPKLELSPDFVHVGLDGDEAYNVIVGNLTALYNPRRSLIHVQVFDPTDNSWTVESYTSTGTNCGEVGGSVFTNGVLYVLVYTWERPSGYGYTLISLNVKEKFWKEIPYLCQVFVDKPNLRLGYRDVRFSELFVCGSNVMLVVSHVDRVPNPDFDPEHDSSDTEELNDRVVSVLQLDVERGLVFELSRAPKKMVSPALAMGGIGSAAAQGDYIYVGGGHISRNSSAAIPILFNVKTQEWDWVNPATYGLLPFTRRACWQWKPFAYQPGLNPFLEVRVL